MNVILTPVKMEILATTHMDPTNACALQDLQA